MRLDSPLQEQCVYDLNFYVRLIFMKHLSRRTDTFQSSVTKSFRCFRRRNLAALVSSCAAHFIIRSTRPRPNSGLHIDCARSTIGGDRGYDTTYRNGSLLQRIHYECKRQRYLELFGSADRECLE